MRGQNEYIDSIEWEKGIAKDIILKDGSYILVDVHVFLPAAAKELNEVRGKVISDYQNLLEKAWVTDLKSKYSIAVGLALRGLL